MILEREQIRDALLKLLCESGDAASLVDDLSEADRHLSIIVSDVANGRRTTGDGAVDASVVTVLADMLGELATLMSEVQAAPVRAKAGLRKLRSAKG